MCPLSTTSMATSSCWFVHLACLDELGVLLVLVELCIDVVGGWHCYYCNVGATCECWFSYVVGVISCRCQFSWSSQLVQEIPLHYCCGTYKCIGMQFVNGTLLILCDDCCKVSFYIGTLISSPILPSPNLQGFNSVCLGPMRGTNMCFLYEDQDINKCVRFG